MSLIFNMLSRFVIAFLPRSKRLLIFWMQSPSAVILEPPKIKSVTVSIVMKWWDGMARCSLFVCWVLSPLFHSPLSPSSRGSLVPLCFRRILCNKYRRAVTVRKSLWNDNLIKERSWIIDKTTEQIVHWRKPSYIKCIIITLLISRWNVFLQKVYLPVTL